MLSCNRRAHSHFSNYWSEAWNGQTHTPGAYGDTIAGKINPILGNPATNYTHPTVTWDRGGQLWGWTDMSGAVSEDLIRENCDPGTPIFHTVQYTVDLTQANPTSRLLLAEEHIAGTISYLVNAAEIIWINWPLNPYTFAANGPKRMATWYNAYALRDNNCDPSPCVHCPGQSLVGCTPSECPSFPCANDCGLDWKQLHVEGDDWPLTFIVNQHSGGVPTGVVSGKEGKQMSFTDLTHK